MDIKPIICGSKKLFIPTMNLCDCEPTPIELPESIVITTNPTKLIYVDGETIDDAGMVVTAYKEDGTIWDVNVSYPDGIIPNDELILDPDKADAGGTPYPSYYGFMIIEDPIPGAHDLYNIVPDTMLGYGQANFHGLEITVPSGYGVTITVTCPETGRSVVKTSAHYYSSETEISFYAYKMNGDYYLGMAAFTGSTGSGTNIIFDSHPISWLFGGEEPSTTQEITVKWNRPVDGRELTDTFDITVT